MKIIKVGKWKKKAKFVRKDRNYSVLKNIHDRIVPSYSRKGEWRTVEINKLIQRARKELGYSDNTTNIDIINTLYRASRSAS